MRSLLGLEILELCRNITVANVHAVNFRKDFDGTCQVAHLLVSRTGSYCNAVYSSGVRPGASRPFLNQSAAALGMPFWRKQWPSMLQHCKYRGVPSTMTQLIPRGLKFADGLVQKIHLLVGGGHVVMGLVIFIGRGAFTFRLHAKLFEDLGEA